MTPGGIAYDCSGQGELALLLLPGWCGPRTLFEPLMTRLDGYRLLGLDWRGHGESKASDADFGTAELVEDALDVLEHAGVDRVVPVSAAHAGWVAIELRRRLGPSLYPASCSSTGWCWAPRHSSSKHWWLWLLGQPPEWSSTR